MAFFSTITLRGVQGRLVWGYRTAAELSVWSIHRPNTPEGQWTLTATIATVDRFSVLQRPLLFFAPRRQGSHWCWPIRRLDFGEGRVIATLGPPEH
jgi:hypothetical protein